MSLSLHLLWSRTNFRVASRFFSLIVKLILLATWYLFSFSYLSFASLWDRSNSGLIFVFVSSQTIVFKLCHILFKAFIHWQIRWLLRYHTLVTRLLFVSNLDVFDWFSIFLTSISVHQTCSMRLHSTYMLFFVWRNKIC